MYLAVSLLLSDITLRRLISSFFFPPPPVCKTVYSQCSVNGYHIKLMSVLELKVGCSISVSCVLRVFLDSQLLIPLQSYDQAKTIWRSC